MPLLKAGNSSASSFSPISLSPTLWLDASDSSTLFTDSGATTPAVNNGDAIGSWRDKSGNSRHFTQSGATRPTLVTSSSPSRIAFTGGQNLDAASTALFSSGNADLTLFVVYMPNEPSGQYGTILANISAGNFALYCGNNHPATYTVPFGVFNNGNVDLSSDSYSSGTKLITIQRSSGNFTAWQGTTQKNTVANSQSVYSGAGTASVWSIGANTINSEAFEGSIAEIIAVNSAVGSANRLACQNHLMEKWGAT